MSYSVYLCQPFKRSVKLLLNRFPHVKDDVALALREILQSPSVGVVIPGGDGVRKVRIKSSDLQRGKSGGFRLLYLVEPEQQLVCPLLLYAKSDRQDVTLGELRQLLRELINELPDPGKTSP
jgi:mRNA-degrading endonuclease RelE of RelBE toxin-antitoxin system